MSLHRVVKRRLGAADAIDVALVRAISAFPKIGSKHDHPVTGGCR